MPPPPLRSGNRSPTHGFDEEAKKNCRGLTLMKRMYADETGVRR
jgi:hypothetical protein